MNGDLTPEEVTKGIDVWFFAKPKDPIPTMRTKVHEIYEDFRGRVFIEARGIPEPYPIYHFRKANPEIEKYSSTVPLVECDTLYMRLGY